MYTLIHTYIHRARTQGAEVDRPTVGLHDRAQGTGAAATAAQMANRTAAAQITRRAAAAQITKRGLRPMRTSCVPHT